MAAGFFGLIASFVHNLPQLCMHGVIFSPFEFVIAAMKLKDTYSLEGKL